MNIDMFNNILSESFDDTEEDILYLVRNGYIEVASVSHLDDKHVFIKIKEFTWSGEQEYFGNSLLLATDNYKVEMLTKQNGEELE